MKLLEDDRTITSIWYSDDSGIQVGKNNVTGIKVYGEPGQMSLVPWFKVYKDETELMRVNAAMVETVMYEKDLT